MTYKTGGGFYINARFDKTQTLNPQIVFYEYDTEDAKLHIVRGLQIVPGDVPQLVSPGDEVRIGSFLVANSEKVDKMQFYVDPFVGSITKLTIKSENTIIGEVILTPGHITTVNIGREAIPTKAVKKFDLYQDVGSFSTVNVEMLATDNAGSFPVIFSPSVSKK